MCRTPTSSSAASSTRRATASTASGSSTTPSRRTGPPRSWSSRPSARSRALRRRPAVRPYARRWSGDRPARALAQLVLERAQARGLVLGDQRIDHVVQRLALHDLGQVVERQVDAVVGHPALRVVVGADALGTGAGADLALACVGAGGVQR